MGWRDKVDVMCATFLQAEHHFRQTSWGDLLTMAELADWVVLAEPASQITAGEEYGARPIGTSDRRFFTKVEVAARNARYFGGFADALHPLQSIYPAFTRTEFTGFHEPICDSGSFC